MICTCCGTPGEGLGRINIRRDPQFVCDPCVPARGKCSGKGYHFYSEGNMPKQAVMDKGIEKKKSSK